MQAIGSQPNFTGIYRIKNTPQNVKELSEKVLPMYEYIRKEPFTFYIGDNPFVQGLDIIKEIVANANQASKAWLEMNAKNHGQILPNSNTDFIHIITSKKDVQEFVEYALKRLKALENTPLNRIKNFFRERFGQNENPNLPEHLQIMDKAINLYEAEKAEFNKYLQGKNIVSVSSPQDLLYKMMIEK